MAVNELLMPRANAALVNRDGTGTIEFRNFLLQFVRDAGAAGAVTAEQLAALTARVQALEDAALEDMLQGFASVAVNGNIIYLVGDVANPQGSQYYGTNRDGVRGWYNIIDGFETGTGLIKTVSTDGFNFLGYITSTSELPPTGTLNDAYILNGQYIYWNGTEWANGGSPSNVATLALAPLADSGIGTFKAITRDAYGRVSGSRDGVADDVPVAHLTGSTYDNLQESINVLNSPGLITGGVLSDAGGGNVAWTAGTIAIRANDSDVATLYMGNFPAGTAAIPNDSTTRFLGVTYNSGNPIVVVKTSNTWNYDTEFPIGEVANSGGTLFPFSNPFKVGDPITNIIQRFDAQAYAIRSSDGGLLMSTDGTTRNLDLTAGIIWARLNDYPISARSSTTTPLISIRPSGTTPPLIFTPGFTQWPNTQYLSGTTLTTMTNNRWANLWVFVNIGTGAWGFAYGTAEYNDAAAASAEQVPAYLTQNFLRQNLLLGRLLFEKNSTTPIIESAFTRVFSTQAVSNHNQLSGLQGGTLNEYYHLTAAQIASVGTAVQSVVAGTGIAVNNTDPRNPIVSATGGTGTVTSVAAANATGITWSGSPITTSGTLTPTLATNLQILSTNTWTPEVIGKNFNLAGTDATEISLGVKNDGGGTAVFHYYTKPLSGLPLSGSIIGGAGSRPWDGTSWTAHSTAAYHLLASENQTPTASGTDFRIVATPIGTTQANRIVNSDFNGDGDIINSLGLTRRKINALERGRGIELVRTNNACEISMVSDLSTSTYQSLFRGYSIGGTIASPAATANNMGTGYALCGHDGTSYVGAKALVSLLTFAAWSNTSTPTTIVLETTATGSTARTARWFVKDTGHFYPGADNAYDMGTPTFRVRQYYGVNTSISTSDATLKTEPRDISGKEIDAFLEIGRLPMVWQWLSRVEAEGSKARIHSGPTVQAAIAVMQRHGLEWTDYAAFCYDEWEAHPEFLNEDGDVTAAAVPSGCRYSFRKEELIWWVMRAYIARQDRIEEKLNSL